MKNIIFIAIAILLCSCEKLLLEKPKAIAVENFYSNANELETAIAAIYAPLKPATSFGADYIVTHEVSSDWFIGRGSYAVLNDYQGLIGTKLNSSGSKWIQFYLSIRNANLVIKNVPLKAQMSETDKSKYIAEAKFLRALNYFQLVRSWAGVPLRTEDNIEIPDVPRSSVAEVYQLITDDLLFAEASLPDNPSVPGRATKWAAKTALADVYFAQGLYDKALAESNDVIQSQKFSLVQISTAQDFDKIFGPTVVTSTEEIFYLKFSALNIWNLPYYTGGVKTPYLGVDGYMAIYGLNTNPLYLSWDDNDLRKTYNWFLWDFGLGSNTLLNKKFVDPGRSPRNDYPMYRYTDVLLIYAESSCRVNGAPTADGMEKLNMVHRRAYGYDPLMPSVIDLNLTDYDKDSFITLAIKERGYETQAEGKRWFDLIRAGVAKDYIKFAEGKDIAERHFLWDIPIEEMQYNKALDPSKDQNPGY